jgi:NAD+-dependent protein deacetylase sirtuin 4
MIADPQSPLPESLEPFDLLLDLLRGRRVVVLAGAGCSTESGIPDYRSPQAAPRRRPPVQYQEFVRNAAARARYWARSSIGWPRFSAARPNAGHVALARLEAGGIVTGIITQNVDGLHHAAGSRAVIELHGSLAAVRCLDCDQVTTRDAHQRLLLELNAQWRAELGLRLEDGRIRSAPDGDAELPDTVLDRFTVPDCGECGGILKPDVVFFGENVPKARVADAWHQYAAGDALLVVGSSLTVYSGRRFIDRARQDGVPIGIVNLGPTRADDAAAAKVEAPLGTVLPRLAELLLD